MTATKTGDAFAGQAQMSTPSASRGADASIIRSRARKDQVMTDPEIHTWWPRLSADAKSTLDAMDGEIIPEMVRDEVEQITGSRMSRYDRLSITDRDFIRTQREAVD